MPAMVITMKNKEESVDRIHLKRDGEIFGACQVVSSPTTSNNKMVLRDPVPLSLRSEGWIGTCLGCAVCVYRPIGAGEFDDRRLTRTGTEGTLKRPTDRTPPSIYPSIHPSFLPFSLISPIIATLCYAACLPFALPLVRLQLVNNSRNRLTTTTTTMYPSSCPDFFPSPKPLITIMNGWIACGKIFGNLMSTSHSNENHYWPRK
ncbi:unnamed protein product [Onchocerca flexuosa]|uniref:BTB/POZ domain-containing protein n=1 Tax=Onchocerca flexuosa TaxID=387005 RepID=A0A183HRP1_9BILA|nr:unnamed protein product [Onchocerca flexuosa]